MKRLALFALAAVAAISAAACSGPARPGASAASSMSESSAAESSANETSGEQARWDDFLQALEDQGIAYEAIHTLENSGITREAILSMTPEDIRNELAEIEAVIRQNKAVLAAELLADWDIAKHDPQFVYSDHEGSTSLGLVEDAIASVRADNWGGFTGLLLGSTTPVAYEVSYQPGGELLLTRYSGAEEPEIRESAVTDVYTTETFFHFTNGKDVFFSIPRVSLAEAQEVDHYPNDSGFEASVTVEQAEEAMARVSGLVAAHLAHARETYGSNAMNGYGIVIPEGLTPQDMGERGWTAEVDGTAHLSGRYYYRVSYYQNGEFAGESYYIDAEDPGAGTAFLISMVDGQLIPVCFQGADHFAVGGAQPADQP